MENTRVNREEAKEDIDCIITQHNKIVWTMPLTEKISHHFTL